MFKCCSVINGIVEAKYVMGTYGYRTLSRNDGEGSYVKENFLMKPTSES